MWRGDFTRMCGEVASPLVNTSLLAIAGYIITNYQKPKYKLPHTSNHYTTTNLKRSTKQPRDPEQKATSPIVQPRDRSTTTRPTVQQRDRSTNTENLDSIRTSTIAQIMRKLENNYLNFWQEEINTSMKLDFYRLYKTGFCTM